MEPGAEASLLPALLPPSMLPSPTLFLRIPSFSSLLKTSPTPNCYNLLSICSLLERSDKVGWGRGGLLTWGEEPGKPAGPVKLCRTRRAVSLGVRHLPPGTWPTPGSKWPLVFLTRCAPSPLFMEERRVAKESELDRGGQRMGLDPKLPLEMGWGLGKRGLGSGSLVGLLGLLRVLMNVADGAGIIPWVVVLHLRVCGWAFPG